MNLRFINLLIATWLNLNFQNRNSPLIEQLIFFHDHTILVVQLIILFVGYLIYSLTLRKFTNRLFISGQLIEIIWTILPTIILLLIAFPSLHLLYLLDETKTPTITFKVIGNQWYWTYEFSRFKPIEFDSYLNKENSYRRLLETDNKLILPFNIQSRAIITATDVIHAWTIPSLGIKVDATPGRLNQINIYTNRIGNFFGQCSEICGANHSFIPISLELTKPSLFFKWINFK